MKIFNWVHRRFNQKEAFGGDVKKAEFISRSTTETDRKGLLENVALADVLDGWKGGILAIGTFGFDPLKEFNNRNETESYSINYKEVERQCESEEEDYSMDDDECDEDYEMDLEDEEMNPLVYTACPHGFEKDHEDRLHTDHVREAAKVDLLLDIDGIPISATTHEVVSNPSCLESDKGKKKERITLADLFSADSELPMKPDLVKSVAVPDFCKKPSATASAKNGLSFAKKLIPRVGDDARPIQKLHRLMTKMLKRRIHPDFDVKMEKKENRDIKSSGLVPDQFAVNDSISLLQTQVV